MALVLSGALIAVCTLVRLVGQRLDDAEERRSRRQWQVMCEALDLEDFAAVAAAHELWLPRSVHHATDGVPVHAEP